MAAYTLLSGAQHDSSPTVDKPAAALVQATAGAPIPVAAPAAVAAPIVAPAPVEEVAEPQRTTPAEVANKSATLPSAQPAVVAPTVAAAVASAVPSMVSDKASAAQPAEVPLKPVAPAAPQKVDPPAKPVVEPVVAKPTEAPKPTPVATPSPAPVMPVKAAEQKPAPKPELPAKKITPVAAPATPKRVAPVSHQGTKPAAEHGAEVVADTSGTSNATLLPDAARAAAALIAKRDRSHDRGAKAEADIVNAVNAKASVPATPVAIPKPEISVKPLPVERVPEKKVEAPREVVKPAEVSAKSTNAVVVAKSPAGDKAWVRIGDQRTVIVSKGQSVPGLGAFQGVDGKGAHFDSGVVPVNP